MPFPGDWFGPRDELVPIGAAANRAREEQSAEAHSDAPPSAGGDDDGSGAALNDEPWLRPEDFWGGAAIEDVLAAPVSAPGDRRSVRARAARSTDPRRAARLLAEIWASSTVRTRLVAAAAIVVACAALLGAQLGARSGAPREVAAHSSTAAAPWLPVPLAALPIPIPIPRLSEGSGSIHHRVRPADRRARRRAGHRSVRVAVAAARHAVASTTPASSGSTQQFASEPDSNAAAAAPGQTSASASHSSTSPPAGPTGRAALIGAGSTPSR